MNEVAEAIDRGGKGGTIFGILTVILGIFAVMAPMIAGASVALVVGVLVLAAGIARTAWAFQADSFGKGVLKFLLGGLTIICGLMMIGRPLFAAGLLTILLTAYFIVDGVFELIAAFQLRPESGWGWLLFGGIVSLVLGIMIWRQYPLSGMWAIGVLLGIKLIFAGLEMMMIGSAARGLAAAAKAE